MRPWLEPPEIAELCEPLTQPHAQIRYLRKVLQLHVERKHDGTPLLMRSELERVVGAGRISAAAQNAPAGPNVVGLQAWAQGRRGHGAKTQGR